jgi:hypothetical protein
MVDVTIEFPGEEVFDFLVSRQVLHIDERYQVGIPEHAPGDPGDHSCPGDHTRDPVPDMRSTRVGRWDGQE